MLWSVFLFDMWTYKLIGALFATCFYEIMRLVAKWSMGEDYGLCLNLSD